MSYTEGRFYIKQTLHPQPPPTTSPPTITPTVLYSFGHYSMGPLSVIEFHLIDN